MTSDTATYRRDLILALRVQHVPPDRIGEIVAEVESHVADTGEDPRAAFGPPREYATHVAATSGGLRAVHWLLTVSAAGCGFLVAVSVLDVLDGEAGGCPPECPRGWRRSWPCSSGSTAPRSWCATTAGCRTRGRGRG